MSRLQQALRAAGVGEGDRVAAMLPNMPEAIASMLATTSHRRRLVVLLARFRRAGVLDRFGQIEPKCSSPCDGYWYAGKASAGRSTSSQAIAAATADASASRGRRLSRARRKPSPTALPSAATLDGVSSRRSPPRRRDSSALPFDHPLYILYLVGHDRRAQMHRPWRRRHAAPAPQGTPAALRRARRRPALLLHDLRLDDVELAGLGARRRTRRCCSTTARRSTQTAACCSTIADAERHDALRHLGEIHRRAAEGRR